MVVFVVVVQLKLFCGGGCVCVMEVVVVEVVPVVLVVLQLCCRCPYGCCRC